MKIRKEIEDANRICVLAGDFFMATASTQLAEIENQLVVKQISKERTKLKFSGPQYREMPLENFLPWKTRTSGGYKR